MFQRLVLAIVLSVAIAAALMLTSARESRDAGDARIEHSGQESHDQGPATRCARCHAEIVAAYRDHGMSRSIGAAGVVPAGSVMNPVTKSTYEIASTGNGAVLTATTAERGTRRQAIVGRIGAGIFDTSWVTAEIDGATSRTTTRLFFAPVEAVTGHGLTLSPFELHPPGEGVDFALTNDCLTCHTTDVPRPPPYPANDLGADAFTRLSPLTCAACHGDVERHARVMSGDTAARAQGPGLTRIARLAPPSQRDICARCHLQGDARIELIDGPPRLDRPIASQIPVLVPEEPTTDFRFVGQLERLALSACFRQSPAMTCTTCHDPHTAVKTQGTARFDRACARCHAGAAKHAPSLDNCVRCHVRRSQPFDLPHVRTADHFIRRRIEAPRDVPHRSFARPGANVAVYDDGRLRDALKTSEGRRWEAGVRAMGLLSFGRFREAAAAFDQLPAPGSEAARTPSAPAGFAPLETRAAFHTARGLALIATGRIDAARAALSDAIAIDPRTATARLARARLSLDGGDIRTAMLDTQAVIDAYPQAEQPWDLRIEIAQRAGRVDLALSAADASTRLWPSNARAWMALAGFARQRGDNTRATAAMKRAEALVGPGRATAARD